jgi:hypothetical protein
MRKTLVAALIGVLGLGVSAAFANATLDFSPNSSWRTAPEATATQSSKEAPKLTRAYEHEQPYVFNP